MYDELKFDNCAHSSDPLVGCALEGVASVFAGIRGATVVIHSPQGCAATVAAAFDQHEVDFTKRKIACTRLFESDIVMGATRKLEDLIRQSDAKFGNPVLFVVGTCAADIIGEDLDGICRNLQPEIKGKLIPVTAGGFRGDAYAGIEMGLEALLPFVKKSETKIPNSVNLIAPHASVNPTWWADLDWIQGLLEEFGIKVVSRIVRDTTLADLDKAGEASANILLSHDAGYGFAKKFERLHGVPLILSDIPLPVGLGNTSRWLKALASHFGAEGLADFMIQNGEEKVADILRRRALMMIPRYRNCRVAVSGDATFAISSLRMLFQELEMIPEAVLVRSKSKEARALLAKECADLGISPKIVFGADGYKIQQVLKDIPVDAVLGSAWETYMAKEEGIRIAFDAFTPTNRDVYVDRAYFGYDGMVNLLEIIGNDWERALRSRDIQWDLYEERRTVLPTKETERVGTAKIA